MSRILLFLPCLLFLSLASCDFAPGTSSPLSEPSQPLTIAMASETPVPSVPPIENPYSAQPGDDLLTHDRVFLDTQELLIEQGLPPLIILILQGNLPTPCHQLRVDINPPDDNNRIFAEVYSVADPEIICIQVLEPFEAHIPLDGFSSGQYTVWVNGEQVGKFNQ